MTLRNLIRNFLQKLREINDKDLLDEITNLKAMINTLTSENVGLTNYIEELQTEIDELNSALLTLNKHDSLENYSLWLEENVKPVIKYYDFGSGKKQVHTIFADSIKDEDIIRDFIENDLEFDASLFETPDDLVHGFNVALSEKYPTVDYYDSDQDLYGKLEYWATAKETIEKLRDGGKAFDCDDSMVLRYSCLYYLLDDYYPGELWRLRGFIVDIWTGGGHALLAWIKQDVNDWVPIETTFYDMRNPYIWQENYRIRDQMLYQIRYSFDRNHEYERI